MVLTKINPIGNFDCWSPSWLREIKNKNFSSNIGQPLFENAELKLWQIVLEPKERLPFRRHLNAYSCNCLIDGLLLSRNANGAIDLLRFERGETYFRECKEEAIHDLENVGENTVKITIVEDKLILSEKSLSHLF
ncbi:hypothetical protein ACFQZJ_12860 [Maribacter chungangensis]|uniref:Cupin domain-containing protein n=1 Tax=Maribacter chungangensis TaxID=1069117 RepID=A0ABW3B5K7_9FLAO